MPVEYYCVVTDSEFSASPTEQQNHITHCHPLNVVNFRTCAQNTTKCYAQQKDIAINVPHLTHFTMTIHYVHIILTHTHARTHAHTHAHI